MGKLNTVFVHVVYYFDMSNNSLLLLHGNECLTMKDVQCKIGTIRKGTIKLRRERCNTIFKRR